MLRKSGFFEPSSTSGEVVQAFVPHAMPPQDPPLEIAGELAELLRQAMTALLRLDVAGRLVPSVDWFVYAFVRKEAVLSAQIEGTQATLIDLLATEAAPDEPLEGDVDEVCGYLAALRYGTEELDRKGGLPMSMRLLMECHARLLAGARGAKMQPGVIRRSQNWLGGTRPGNAAYVPPPPHRLPDLLSDFERSIHSECTLPALVRIGLLHAHFESIHPFLDGNGRLGRLLITLLLRHFALLGQPLLYLSLYLKSHRQEYYQRLNATRTHGDFEGWLAFFLEGVKIAADQAVRTATALNDLMKESRSNLLARADATVLSLRLLELLPQHPLLTVSATATLLSCSRPAATKTLDLLASAELLHPMDQRKKNRTLGFLPYLAILREDTDPLE